MTLYFSRQTLHYESKWAVSWSCPSQCRSSHITYALGNIYLLMQLLAEFRLSDESPKPRERKHGTRAWSTGTLDWVLLFLSPASHIYFVPLCLKSNWSSKTRGKDWIADWIAFQGHLSIAKIHSCSSTAAYGHCRFYHSSQKQLQHPLTQVWLFSVYLAVLLTVCYFNAVLE